MTTKTRLLLPFLLACAACEEPAPPGPATSTSVASSATKPSSAKPVASNAPPPSQSGSAAPSSSVATAPVTVPAEGTPTCKKSNEKVQADDAYAMTGLTTKRFKGDLAVGFGFQGAKVLVIDDKGGTKVLDVAGGEKTNYANKAKDTWRGLLRVSPRDISGKTARAFVDYADYNIDKSDKKRHVWCGPADANETFLEWSGTSWLDLDPKPTGDEKKSKYFNWKKLGGYIELRDCRTFVTLDGDKPWALGSMLRGVEKPDGTNEWKTVLLVDYGKGDDEVVLSEVPLKGDPPTLATYEIPVMRRVGDKGFVVAARFGGALWVAVLDKDRKVIGAPKTYPGWPTSPAIGTTKDDLYILSGVATGKEKSLKGLKISKEKLALPASYEDIALTAMDPSGDAETQFFGPELTTDAKGGLWLLYIEGAPNKGRLRIVPVGADLQPIGRSFPITTGTDYVTEARLQPLADGRFTVAYLKNTAGKTKLVTEDLACEVQK